MNPPLENPPASPEQTVRKALQDLRARLDEQIAAPAPQEPGPLQERRTALLTIRREYENLLAQIRTMRSQHRDIGDAADSLHGTLTRQLPDVVILAPTAETPPAPTAPVTPEPEPEEEHTPTPQAPEAPQGVRFTYANPATAWQYIVNGWDWAVHWGGFGLGKVREFFSNSPFMGSLFSGMVGGWLGSHFGSAAPALQQGLNNALTPGPTETAVRSVLTANVVTMNPQAFDQAQLTTLNTSFNSWKRVNATGDEQQFAELVIQRARQPGNRTQVTPADVIAAARYLANRVANAPTTAANAPQQAIGRLPNGTVRLSTSTLPMTIQSTPQMTLTLTFRPGLSGGAQSSQPLTANGTITADNIRLVRAANGTVQIAKVNAAGSPLQNNRTVSVLASLGGTTPLTRTFTLSN